MFSSLEKARNFLEIADRLDMERYGEDLHRRYYVTEVFLDVGKEAYAAALNYEETTLESPCGRYWQYATRGRLLFQRPDSLGEKTNFDMYDCDGNYRVGDIVYVLPQADAPDSDVIEGVFAVVATAPTAKKEWLRASKSPEEWDGLYVVYYVDEFGYFDHVHVPERCLAPPPKPLPRELRFLHTLADAFTGSVPFSQDFWDKLWVAKGHGQLFLLDVETFDFSQSYVRGDASAP